MDLAEFMIVSVEWKKVSSRPTLEQTSCLDGANSIVALVTGGTLNLKTLVAATHRIFAGQLRRWPPVSPQLYGGSATERGVHVCCW